MNIKIENYIHLVMKHRDEINDLSKQLEFYENKLRDYLSKKKSKSYQGDDVSAQLDEYTRAIVDMKKLEKMLSATQLKKVKKQIKCTKLCVAG